MNPANDEQTKDLSFFGFFMGMQRRECLQVAEKEYTLDSSTLDQKEVKGAGEWEGFSCRLKWMFDQDRLVMLFISPNIEVSEVVDRTIGQSRFYLALNQMLGVEGQFPGHRSASDQFGSATWKIGDMVITFSLDGGHHDYSGQSFISADVVCYSHEWNESSKQ